MRVSQRNAVPLLAGAGAIIVLFLLVFLSLDRRPPGGEVSFQSLGGPVIPTWRRYEDERGRFALRYPATWEIEASGEGIALRPRSRRQDGVKAEAIFVLHIGNPVEGAPDRPAQLWSLLERDGETVRVAENVAVGGLSGVEVVKALPADRGEISTSLRQDVHQFVAPAQGQVTMVLWHTARQEPSYWVLMIDAQDGHFLPLLEQVRDSIVWDGYR